MNILVRKFLLFGITILLVGQGCASSQTPTNTYLQSNYEIGSDSSSTSISPVNTAKSTSSRSTITTSPNGTYVNVDGNTIPSPYYAPSIPSGEKKGSWREKGVRSG